MGKKQKAKEPGARKKDMKQSSSCQMSIQIAFQAEAAQNKTRDQPMAPQADPLPRTGVKRKHTAKPTKPAQASKKSRTTKPADRGSSIGQLSLDQPHGCLYKPSYKPCVSSSSSSPQTGYRSLAVPVEQWLSSGGKMVRSPKGPKKLLGTISKVHMRNYRTDSEEDTEKSSPKVMVKHKYALSGKVKKTPSPKKQGSVVQRGRGSVKIKKTRVRKDEVISSSDKPSRRKSADRGQKVTRSKIPIKTEKEGHVEKLCRPQLDLMRMPSVGLLKIPALTTVAHLPRIASDTVPTIKDSFEKLTNIPSDKNTRYDAVSGMKKDINTHKESSMLPEKTSGFNVRRFKKSLKPRVKGVRVMSRMTRQRLVEQGWQCELNDESDESLVSASQDLPHNFHQVYEKFISSNTCLMPPFPPPECEETGLVSVVHPSTQISDDMGDKDAAAQNTHGSHNYGNKPGRKAESSNSSHVKVGPESREASGEQNLQNLVVTTHAAPAVPAKSAPAHAAPVHSTSAHHDPAHSAPAHTTPAHAVSEDASTCRLTRQQLKEKGCHSLELSPPLVLNKWKKSKKVKEASVAQPEYSEGSSSGSRTLEAHTRTEAAKVESRNHTLKPDINLAQISAAAKHDTEVSAEVAEVQPEVHDTEVSAEVAEVQPEVSKLLQSNHKEMGSANCQQEGVHQDIGRLDRMQYGCSENIRNIGQQVALLPNQSVQPSNPDLMPYRPMSVIMEDDDDDGDFMNDCIVIIKNPSRNVQTWLQQLLAGNSAAVSDHRAHCRTRQPVDVDVSSSTRIKQVAARPLLTSSIQRSVTASAIAVSTATATKAVSSAQGSPLVISPADLPSSIPLVTSGNLPLVSLCSNSLPAPSATVCPSPPENTCQYVSSPSTNTYVAPPFTYAAVAALSTSTVLAPSTNTAVAPPSTDTTMAAPSTNTAVAPPSANTTMAPPSTNTAVAPPSTNTAMAPSSINTAMAPPSTNTTMAPPSTNTAVAPPSTNTAMAPPSTNTAMAPPSTNTTIAPPSTNTAMAAPSTNTAMAASSTNTAMAAPSTNTAMVASSTNTAMASPSTNTAMAASSTNTAMAPPFTNTAMAAPSTNTAMVAPSTNTAMAASSTNTALVPPSTNTAMAPPSTDKAMAAPSTNTAMTAPYTCYTNTAMAPPSTNTAMAPPSTNTAMAASSTNTAAVLSFTNTAVTPQSNNSDIAPPSTSATVILPSTNAAMASALTNLVPISTHGTMVPIALNNMAVAPSSNAAVSPSILNLSSCTQLLSDLSKQSVTGLSLDIRNREFPVTSTPVEEGLQPQFVVDDSTCKSIDRSSVDENHGCLVPDTPSEATLFSGKTLESLSTANNLPVSSPADLALDANNNSLSMRDLAEGLDDMLDKAIAVFDPAVTGKEVLQLTGGGGRGDHPEVQVHNELDTRGHESHPECQVRSELDPVGSEGESHPECQVRSELDPVGSGGKDYPQVQVGSGHDNGSNSDDLPYYANQELDQLATRACMPDKSAESRARGSRSKREVPKSAHEESPSVSDMKKNAKWRELLLLHESIPDVIRKQYFQEDITKRQLRSSPDSASSPTTVAGRMLRRTPQKTNLYQAGQQDKKKLGPSSLAEEQSTKKSVKANSGSKKVYENTGKWPKGGENSRRLPESNENTGKLLKRSENTGKLLEASEDSDILPKSNDGTGKSSWNGPWGHSADMPGPWKTGRKAAALDLQLKQQQMQLEAEMKQKIFQATHTEQEPHLGELVWAQLGRGPWWPAVVVLGMHCGMKPARKGWSWVFWYGDHKVSTISHKVMVPFAPNFNAHYNSKGTKLYLRAVVEILQECALRAARDITDPDDLIIWACAGCLGETDLEPNAACPIPQFALQHLRKIAAMNQRSDSESDSDDEDEPTNLLRIEIAQKKKESCLKAVRSGIISITEVCIICDKPGQKIASQHPLFEGGLCAECKSDLMDTMFAIGEDGTNVFCVICGNAGDLYVCEDNTCNRVYCSGCILELGGEKVLTYVAQCEDWLCFLCTPPRPNTHGLLVPKPLWRENIVSLFRPKGVIEPVIPLEFECHPIRVLSLFDGIGTGRLILSELGIEVDKYFASEVDQDAITVTRVRHTDVTHIGDITSLDYKKVSSLAPIDLLIGGSPCNEISIVNPARKGLEGGTGQLFFEFHRVMCLLQECNRGRHLFWLFENVSFMPVDIKATISRFLSCEPALWDAKHFSAQKRARYFWGNIPGMYCPPDLSTQGSMGLDANLSDVLMNTRVAKVKKVRTMTTRGNSLIQGKAERSFPVQMGDSGDTLWIPEMERVFGFPDHYTDVGNLPVTRRHKLLGKSWSVPVVKHLLRPLKQFFSQSRRENTPVKT